MAWITRLSGLPTQTDLPLGDTFSTGQFTLSTNTGAREWDATGLLTNVPIAYETLSSLRADIAKVLRVTGRYASRAAFTGEDGGAGVVLYGPNKDDACLVRSNETDPSGSPGAGDVTGKAWEDDAVTTIATTALPTTAAPPNQFRIYWNPLGSAFVIPDSGFGSWSVAAGTASYWYSDDDGTTWTRLGDRNIAAGVAPDKVGIYAHVGVPNGGTPSIVFSSMEVMEDDNDPPVLQNLNPDDLDTGVLVGDNIVLEVYDNGDVDAATVVIQLKRGAAAWESVWTGDAQQSGYAVTKTPITGGFQYTINPDTDLPYEETIQVRVQADDTVGNSMDETYSFETQLDLNPPTLQNLNPAADAEDVAVNSNVYLEVVDLAQVGVDDSTVEIYIRRGPTADWETVWTGDAQQTGYSVTKGSVTDGFSYDINPDVDFPQTEFIYVRVVADDVAITPNEMDASYRFITAGPIELKHQDPAPQEEDVEPLLRPIEFDILDPGANIDTTSVNIWIDGKLVYTSETAGDFWNITRTAIGTAGYNYSIELKEALPWREWIRVRVQASSLVSGSIDETYFFKTQSIVWLAKDDFDDSTPWPYYSGNGTVSESAGQQIYQASGGSTDWYTSGRSGKLPYLSFTPPNYGTLYFEVEIGDVVESGNAHHILALYQNDSNFLWIYHEPTLGIHTYNVVGNSWSYQHAYAGNPLPSFPIRVRFKWNVDTGLLERQVWDNNQWNTITSQTIQISPTKLVHYGKTWSGGSITTKHNYAYIYWEPSSELEKEGDTAGWEDEYVLPTAQGPDKWQSPDGFTQGVGQKLLAGPVDEPIWNPGTKGPYEYAGWEDGPLDFREPGGPPKWQHPELLQTGGQVGAGQRIPGVVDHPAILRTPDQQGPRDTGGWEDDYYIYVSSEPEIRPDTFDVEGHPQLTTEVFWGARYYDSTKDDDYWDRPTQAAFTGYAKDGKHYTGGVQDAGPVWAPWAIEGISDHRSLRADFPDKVLLVWGMRDLVIFDLDSFDGTPNTLKVWMRFLNPQSTSGDYYALGRGDWHIRDAVMANGVLVVVTQYRGSTNGGMFLIDFKQTGPQWIALLRADGLWEGNAGTDVTTRNGPSQFSQVNSSVQVDSEFVYRVDAWAPSADGLYVACVGEDYEDPSIRYFAGNVLQWTGRNYGNDRGEVNLEDYWYKSVLFDEDKWLWYSVDNKLYRNVRRYQSRWTDTSDDNPLIRRVVLPETIRWLATARDYIYAVTEGGIWQIHRGTLEFFLAYSVESSPTGGGQFNNPPDGALIKGGRTGTLVYKVYGVSLSLSSYLGVSVTYAEGGGATIIRLFDDLVLDSFVAPALAEDGCYFVVPVPV